ncbi:MAG TPA: prolyl oligopeptidase family serine peptidase [Blastocatellia bacterium]|jgi:dipeptidyl aminopeptidase/acylaminoacyl peptidase
MSALKNLRLAFGALAIATALSAFAYANGFTLEQALSSPFPSELIASPRGDKIAWVFDAQGRRNIWIAQAPDYRGRQLTRYDKEDGQELLQLAFSPDGNWIAYVRGGEPNSESEIPNPTSDPEGARQEIYLVNTRGGAITRIGEGESPRFSPRGDRVIFARENHLWSATLPAPGARAGGPPKKLFEIRGNVNSPAWSPDASHLAFVSSRGAHSFIAIFDEARRRIKFLDPSVDRDIMPRWSPDGKRIAFIRLFNLVDTFGADRDRLQPWAIRVVEVATGKAKEVWRSGEGAMDSFTFQPLGENMLQWGAGDQIVFASEKEGWAHLYSVPASGGQARALTSGNYEVENAAFSPDRSFIIVASNAGDINRRHLWRVNLAGGEPVPVTRTNGIEMFPAIINGGRHVAFLHATARDPIMPYTAEIGGSNVRPVAAHALASSFPAAQMVEPEEVTFESADQVKVHGQLFKPREAAGRRPAVVFLHGGPVRQMLPAWHYGYYYHNAYAFNQYLASRGYMVLSVNFRCGIGYGRAFREAKNRGARGASEYQDVVAAGKYLRSRPDVDVNRVGLWGGSYGGFLTAMGLARDSDIFAAGVDIHGVHDWGARVSRSPQATSELVRLARESSPINSVDKWKSPVLLIHGDDDRNVAFSQTVDLVRRLRERKVKFEEMIFPDEVHDFLLHTNWLRAYHAAADFFDRHLK